MRLVAPQLPRWLIVIGALALLVAIGTGAAPAQAVAPPGPPTGLLRTTYGPPSIIAGGATMNITAADNHGNIDVWSQYPIGSGWTIQRFASTSGGVFYSSPVEAFSGGYFMYAAVDSGGGLDFWQQSPEHTSWVKQQVATGGYGSPALTTGNGFAMLTAIGPGNVLDFWEQPLGQSGWSQPQPVAYLDSGSSGPSVAWAGPYTVISAANGGGVDSWIQWNGSTYWAQDPMGLNPALTYSTTPTLTVTNSQVELAAAGHSGGRSAVDLWSLPLGQTGWGSPRAVAGGSAPSLGWNGSDLGLATQDAEDNLWFASQSGTWGPGMIAQGSAAGRSYSAPQLGASSYGLAVTASAAGSIYSWSRPAGTTTWTPVLVAAATG